jgi:hypothetical protein
MLWFDDNQQRDLTAKIVRAATHYETKYGARPTLCYLHPSMLASGAAQLTDIEVRAVNNVLPHHFWIGVDDEPITHKQAA